MIDPIDPSTTTVDPGAAADMEERARLKSSPWWPVEIYPVVDGILAGDLPTIEPEVGRVEGGSALFYLGRVNGVAGESGAAKTWTALVCCAQEVANGNRVVFIDLEDNAAGIVGRLLALDVDPDDIKQRFVYLRPDGPFDIVARHVVTSLVEQVKPTLVVIDSTGEALSLDGANPNADEDVAAWFRRVPRALADLGPAVVLLDHLTKADGGLWPTGSQRKRAAISGVQYIQRVETPFSRTTAGASVLVCAKDKAGAYSKDQKVARLAVDPSEQRTSATLVTVSEAERDGSSGVFRPTGYMEKVSRAIEQAGEPLTYNGIRERVTGKREYVRSATDLLVSEGYISTAPGPNRSTLHHHEQAFREGLNQVGPECAPSVPGHTQNRWAPGPLPRTRAHLDHTTASLVGPADTGTTERDELAGSTCHSCGSDGGAAGLGGLTQLCTGCEMKGAAS